MIILDASAVLALLFRESGYEQVVSHMNAACLSTVNLSEVLSRFSRDGISAGEAAAKINQSPIQIYPFSVQEAIIAADLVPYTRPLGLSLGDRACLALAISLNRTVLTADQAWGELNIGLEIILIR